MSREIENVYGAEGPARLALTLERLLAGLDAIGVDRKIGLNIIDAIAKDSVPPIRRRAYEHLDDGGLPGRGNPDYRHRAQSADQYRPPGA